MSMRNTSKLLIFARAIEWQKTWIFHYFYHIQFSWQNAIKRHFYVDWATGKRTLATSTFHHLMIYFHWYDCVCEKNKRLPEHGTNNHRPPEHVMCVRKFIGSFYTGAESARLSYAHHVICILYRSGNEIFHFGTKFDGLVVVRVPSSITGSPWMRCACVVLGRSGNERIQ